jgi:hypothetical protein
LIYSFLIILSVNFILSNLLYKGKVFAGGDSDLLLALTPLLAQADILGSLFNLFFFIFLVLISGSIYGIIYIFISYFKNQKKINKEFKRILEFKKLLPFLIFGVLSLLLLLVDISFIYISLMFLIFPFFFIFAKAIENKLMGRDISGSKIYEGDILLRDITVRGKTIKATGKGLTKNQVEFLKNKKKVKIKDGIPFAPAFLLGFILYILIKLGLLSFLRFF